MKQILFSTVLALAVLVPTSAQTQATKPKPAGPQTTRSRVVSSKEDNHAENLNARQLSSAPTLIQKTVMTTPAPNAAANPPARGNAAATLPLSIAGATIYRVGMGDVLDIRLTSMPTRESTLFTVLKNGTIEFPLVAYPLTVAGMTTDEISRLMRQEIKVINDPRVSVAVRDYASHAVVVSGLVDNPGRKFLRRETMPLFAVIAEALPRTEATVVIVTREGKAVSFSTTDDRAMATPILPGDSIKLSAASALPGRFLYVGGDVASPGEREFRDGMTLTQALMAAGGASRNSMSKVKVARRNASGFLIMTEYNLRSIEEGKSPDPFIEAGDRIEVTRIM